MKTTAPADRLPGARTPARPIVPMPLWQRHQLFQEPQFPDSLELEEDADDTDHGAP